ncbi:MAG: DNA-directed RNA polymerase subunit H [Candidatus Aenigmatarchaeota archaeon]
MGKEFSVLKHELVPEHIILDDSEKKELLESLKIKPNQLPKILANDPAVKELEAEEGDILKILRKSPVAGSTTYYRIVVKKK